MNKAIETVYNGYRFRSRLEARWAVFFDALGIKYQYEVEGFELEEGRYLPDFWVPEWDCWIEIKPERPELDHYNKQTCLSEIVHKREYLLCRDLAKHTQKVVMLIGGSPFVEEKGGWPLNELHCKPEYGIALFCPDMIIDPLAISSPSGVKFGLVLDDDYRYKVTEENFSLSRNLYGFIVRKYKEYPDYFDQPLPERGRAHDLIEADRAYWLNKHGREHPEWYYDIAEDDFLFEGLQTGSRSWRICLTLGRYKTDRTHEGIVKAYLAARQARFEHGEQPLNC